MPVSGSFSTYGQKYVEEGFGFALGWNYWYNWAVTIAVDLVAAQLVMTWWFPDTPGWIWSAVPGRHLPAELHLRTRVWRSGILVLFDQSGNRHHLYRRRCGDDRWYFQRAEPAGWSNWTIGDAPFAGGSRR
jgi:lysine-specific permease